jgi:hypothetical protein
MQQHVDVTDRELKVDDLIVYSAADGRSSVLRFGIIVALRPAKVGRYGNETTAKCQAIAVRNWFGDGWEILNNGSPITLDFSERIMVVNRVPDGVAEMLRKAAALRDLNEGNYAC